LNGGKNVINSPEWLKKNKQKKQKKQKIWPKKEISGQDF